MGKMSISIDEGNESWVQEQAGQDADAFVNDMIRREREYQEKLVVLRKAIQDGRTSGLSDRTAREIWEDAKRRYKAENG